MKRKLILACVAAMAVLGIVFAIAFSQQTVQAKDSASRENIAALNEVLELQKAADGGDPAAAEALPAAVSELRENMKPASSDGLSDSQKTALLLFAVCCIFVLAVGAYVYVRVVRPFERLQGFAGEVAKGNLDCALPYERKNLFGDFTWAFDRMRSEIIQTRAAEARAIENGKTVIAELSHDIKTPLASARAYAEALDMGLAKTPEDQKRYAAMVMAKCDEVASLADDLFVHSISELECLRVECVPLHAKEAFESIFNELILPTDTIVVQRPIPDAIIHVDGRRLEQIAGNLIANARKYAPDEPLHISFVRSEDALEVAFEDEGPGVSPQDLPFLFDKFYRGANVGTVEGTGLGLAIVKYLMERMGGSVVAMNTDRGFRVSLRFALSKD